MRVRVSRTEEVARSAVIWGVAWVQEELTINRCDIIVFADFLTYTNVLHLRYRLANGSNAIISSYSSRRPHIPAFRCNITRNWCHLAFRHVTSWEALTLGVIVRDTETFSD